MHRWLYEDSKFLKNNGRNKSCLLLLLCLIDGLAKRKNPSEGDNKKRYVSYLKEKLKLLDIDESYRIEEENQLLHFSEIIYIYFRCFFVHEGDDRELERYEVQIEYDRPKGFKFGKAVVLIDRKNEKIIFKSSWLSDILLNVVEIELITEN